VPENCGYVWQLPKPLLWYGLLIADIMHLKRSSRGLKYKPFGAILLIEWPENSRNHSFRVKDGVVRQRAERVKNHKRENGSQRTKKDGNHDGKGLWNDEGDLGWWYKVKK
jgi:hypothetical protein